MAILKRLEFDVYERPAGWFCTQTNRWYKTALRASKAIDRRCQKITKERGEHTVAIIEWNTTTPVGALVVKAITQ